VIRHLVILFLVLSAGAAAAQESPVLREAVRLATEGRGDSARALVRTHLSGLSPAVPEYAEALFTAGLVSDSASQAIRYFRQVSIEHSSSEWADQALLRLAQLAYAQGDLRSARESAQRILLDYPFSDVKAHAAFWAGRADLELGNEQSGCNFLLQVREAGQGDIEIQNRAGFYLQRCMDYAQNPTPTTPPPAPQPTGNTVYSVQVAAISSAVAADQAMRDLQAMGYTARVVRDTDGLLKIRIGQFRTRGEAEDLAQNVRRRMGGSPFVVEEQQR